MRLMFSVVLLLRLFVLAKADVDNLKKLLSKENATRLGYALRDVRGKKIIENPDFGLLDVYSNGACSTEVPLCSRLGVKILTEGGNAMDSAVACAICVGITNSFSSGIGGGGFMLVREPKKNKLDMVDFRETAPRMFSEEYFLKKFFERERGKKVEGFSVGVPGEVYGLYDAHKRYGRLDWKRLFRENIKISRGFLASAELVKRINKLKKSVVEDPGLKEIYTRNGKLLKEGDMVVRENYARTLEKIRDDPKSFYSGDIADSIVKAVGRRGGVLKKEDLAKYKVKHRNVIEGRYRDYKVYTTSLPTSGPLVVEALKILEKYDLKSLEMKSLTSGKFKHFHLLVEIFKFMMARRGELCDPAFLPGWKKIVEDIVSEETAERVHKKINLEKVLDIREYEMKKAAADDYGTTHINVVDKDDMTVLLTSTVNLEFGAKFMDPRTGIILNNQLEDFYVPEATGPNNVHKESVNRVEPGKRPLSSASPVLLVKDDEIIALGAAGGMRIPTSIIATIFYLSLGKNLKEAIIATRIHNQFVPNITFVEHDIQKELEMYLSSVGHKVEKSLQNSIFTSVQGILVKKGGISEDRIIHAVSDPRKGGEAFGY